MAWKKLCPGTPKKKKNDCSHCSHTPAIPTAAAPLSLPQGPVVQLTQNTARAGSHHRNQKLNQWDIDNMKNTLGEWIYWEDAYCLTYRFDCLCCLGLWGLHSCLWRLPSCWLNLLNLLKNFKCVGSHWHKAGWGSWLFNMLMNCDLHITWDSRNWMIDHICW